MIAQIGSDSDILVYLSPEEIKRMVAERIEGALVRIDSPKKQGILGIIANEAEARKDDYGIRVELDVRIPEAEIFVGDFFYNDFLERGKTGTRYGVMGSKITLRDISRLDGLDAIHLEQIEFYRDNKDRLR
jgi:hypothetical protein